MSKKKIANADEIPEGGSLKFPILRNGKPAEGFVVRFEGKLVAYDNQCRHFPMSLDFPKGGFFAPDGKHIYCQNHGALYEPLTGKCVHGPCMGQSLRRLEIEVVNGEVWLIE